ncbi:hypothetical protein M0R79_02675 [Ignavigranum ruoffiae]|uniref:hypothetical protein n=1 Tax=Ignavigranum ruoffiae TaxID=89093 RepID=UPI00206C65E4|nr:hypothetical protein [Ignavigranum ruoffiae]UPQ86301.1 hypothetical protein M0R79_02675 [Ignavigranum ruoffiae]
MKTKKQSLGLILVILALIAIIYLVSGYFLKPKNEVPDSPTVTDEQMQETSNQATDTKGQPFQEKIDANSPYPVASLDAGISISELRKAMDQYYQEVYTEEEKKMSQTKIDRQDIKRLQDSFKNNDSLKALKANVESVEMQVAGETVYVARIVLPFTYQEAEKTKANNDILVLNEALAQLGNHLIMIAYYDQSNKTLTPMHLTNSLNPLFYNETMKN